MTSGESAVPRVTPYPPDMTTDSVFAIFSTTKAVTGTAVLQLVEERKLDLDAPAKQYLPEIAEVQVLDGFDAAGKPKLRAPKRDITTRMLLLHTAGLAMISLTKATSAWPRSTASPASWPRPRRRCGLRRCSTRATRGNTDPTWIGPDRWWKPSPANGLAR
jgi:CubicO group peptidase (beta-lactamase class C family)